MAVIVTPTPKRLIQRLDQGRHRRADVFAAQVAHLPLEGEDSLFCRCDSQDISDFTEGLPEELETVLYVRDRSLLLGEGQTALCKDIRHAVKPYMVRPALQGKDLRLCMKDKLQSYIRHLVEGLYALVP
jgi:hypothetical protein